MSLPDARRFDEVRAQWQALRRFSPGQIEGFETVKREATALIDAGRWTSGPHDMLSVVGRQRDELLHSRLIAWLLIPTNQHGLGREFLRGFLDCLWPEEAVLRSAHVSVQTEVTRWAYDDLGQLHEARADIVLAGGGMTVVIENKLDAGEQPQQCERLYWSWADQPGDNRWVFLTPAGRPPVTAPPGVVRDAWRTMSYAQVRTVLATAIESAPQNMRTGRATAVQYLATLARAAGA